MSRTSKPAAGCVSYSPKRLHRFLYEQSVVLTGAAHALLAAAERLREVRGDDYTKAATEVHLATLSAIHAALSAHRLVGAYELAAWLENAQRAGVGSG